MRRAHEEVLDVVTLLRVHPGHATPAAVLLAVRVQRQRLDVARVRDRDHHLLLADEVLDVDLVLGVGDLRPAVVAEALGDLGELLLDEREDLVLVAEQLVQLGDALHLVRVLLADLVRLERGQLRQAQVEDRGRLDRGELEALDQLRPGAVAVRRPRG